MAAILQSEFLDVFLWKEMIVFLIYWPMFFPKGSFAMVQVMAWL